MKLHATQTWCKDFVNNWMPKRKITLLFLPALILMKILLLTISGLKELKLCIKFFFPAFTEDLAMAVRIYNSELGKEVWNKNLKRI